MYKCYPEAKRAHLKSGGNFPYLSRADEVNTHLEVQKIRYYFYIIFNFGQIHLLPFQGTRYCAKDPSLIDPDELRAARGEIDLPSTPST